MKRNVLLILMVLGMTPLRAELAGVLRWDVAQDLEPTYRMISRSLQESGFHVVFEPDIGGNLAGFAQRWGEDYNRGGLEGIRAMVFCNAWYANALSNQEPGLLALCPLHITLFHKGPTTSIVFIRPTHAGAGSAALPLLRELEAEVKRAVEAGIKAATGAGG